MARRNTAVKKLGVIQIQDPTLPDVTFELRGHAFRLCYDFQALAVYHQLTDVNPLIDGFDVSPLNFAAVLVSGLLRHQPDTTLEEVQGWLTLQTGRELLPAVLKALNIALPEPNGEAKNDSDPTKA